MDKLTQQDIKISFYTATTNCNLKYHPFVYVMHYYSNETSQKF